MTHIDRSLPILKRLDTFVGKGFSVAIIYYSFILPERVYELYTQDLYLELL